MDIVLLSLLIVLVLIQYNGLTRGSFIQNEVCIGEKFKPRCNQNQKIVIGSAQYGRKKYGKCLSQGVGPVGCFEDVTGYVDSVCFGKSECSVYAADTHLTAANPCSTDYSAYLEVLYECISGMLHGLFLNELKIM